VIRLERDAPVYVAGHAGLVGSAIWRRLQDEGFTNLHGWRSSEVDLRDREITHDAITSITPEVVILAAAKVGGILANATYPVDFLNENVRIQTNVMEAAHDSGVGRLLFLGSSCIYPKLAVQPICEDALLTGPLEPTNEAYAVAKISGVIAVKSYRRQYAHRWISAMPTNLYGPGDNFDLTSSHVLPAMIRKFHEAKRMGGTVNLWGTGSPRREFLHVDDLADACLHLLRTYDSDSPVNVGTGTDISIRELAAMVAETLGYVGPIHWDTTKPDGTPRKLLNTSKLRELGWMPKTTLREGIKSTYAWFVENAVSSSPPN